MEMTGHQHPVHWGKWERGSASDGIMRWEAQVQSLDDNDSTSNDSGNSNDDDDNTYNTEDDQEGPSSASRDAYPWRTAGYKAVLQVVAHDNGWQEQGYFLLVHKASGHAVVVAYFEGSYYSSKCGIKNDYIAGATWCGPVDELFRVAEARLDLKAAGLNRKLSPQDVDYSVWTELYAGVLVWRDAGCPVAAPWLGRWSGPVGQARRWWKPWKTPLAREVVRRARAAAKIQAAFRGWRFRMHVLWNPNTDLGHRWLVSQFNRKASNIVAALVCMPLQLATQLD